MLFRSVDYVGAADAERVVVAMGSACGALEDTVEALKAAGERVGLLKLRLYRPFPAEALVRALPATVRALAVLDRCKEPGSLGEPLYLDVVAAIAEQWAAMHGPGALPRVLGCLAGGGLALRAPYQGLDALARFPLVGPAAAEPQEIGRAHV